MGQVRTNPVSCEPPDRRRSQYDPKPSPAALQSGRRNRLKPPFKSRKRCASNLPLSDSPPTRDHRRGRTRTQRSAGTGVQVRSAHCLVTPTVDRPPRATPGRRVPAAAGTRRAFAGARQTPDSRATSLPRRRLARRFCIGLVKSSRATLLPIAPCGVGFTIRRRLHLNHVGALVA